MTYEEFLNFVPSKCMYETIYDDSNSSTILVIRLLDAFNMVNKAQRTWVGLTDEEHIALHDKFVDTDCYGLLIDATEAKLKEKNT
jgi:hypothetical protein